MSDLRLTEDDRAELLATIEESLDRLSGLVENLLDMSRLQAGALALAIQPIDVADVISAAVASLGPAAYEVIIRVPEETAGGFGRPCSTGTSNRQPCAECHTPQPSQRPAADHSQRPRQGG